MSENLRVIGFIAKPVTYNQKLLWKSPALLMEQILFVLAGDLESKNGKYVKRSAVYWPDCLRTKN
ncbi:hypothetical protein [Peribacillus deserti]|uniref:hypothetical protein n=1 Tax=Peribacillus deserti TaxID=673318 RepID=UPI00115BDED9|nr:hypothetical protein [Peribacillus deserti]